MQATVSLTVTVVHVTGCVILSEYDKLATTVLKCVMMIPTVSLPMQALNKALQSIMGKSNLRFAGMSIAVNISIDGLGLLIPTTRQVRGQYNTIHSVLAIQVSEYVIKGGPL